MWGSVIVIIAAVAAPESGKARDRGCGHGLWLFLRKSNSWIEL